jgi:hypothetical protein
VHLKNLETKELLNLQAAVITELQERNIVRTQNNPLGDYTEWLVSKALDLELQSNSKAGYDGISKNGVRVQIKGRRITPKNKSRQLSVIRKYEDKDFDLLAAVLFNESFEVIEAYLIPHEVVGQYAVHRNHVNARILILKGPILNDPRTERIEL